MYRLIPRPAANCPRNRLFDNGVAQSPLRGVPQRHGPRVEGAGQVDAIAERRRARSCRAGLEGQLPQDTGDLKVSVVAGIAHVAGEVGHVLDVPPDPRRGDDPGAGIHDPAAVLEPLNVRVRLLDADR